MKITTLSAAPERGRPAMQFFLSEGLRLAYLDEGPRDGEPIVLVHGFGSNARVNWVGTGWVDLLAADGRRVIALDNRGHGASEAPHDPALYHTGDMMAEDVRRLMDHLAIERADVMGYSMGARIAAFLSLRHPDRVRCAVWGGMGINLVTGLEDAGEIIAALTADSLAEVRGATGRQFRIFADHSQADRPALAACMISSREPMPAADIARIATPVLVAVGETDDMAGDPHALAALLPHGDSFVIPKRNHMLATGDPKFKAAALAFLAAYS
jgi:pimeloyl-ACP methyl ester carboxylesterase